RRRHTRLVSDWSSDVCSSDLTFKSRECPRSRTKGDLEKYTASKFIRRTGEKTVSFACPARPTFEYLVGPKEYWARVRLEWIGKKIGRASCRERVRIWGGGESG